MQVPLRVKFASNRPEPLRHLWFKANNPPTDRFVRSFNTSFGQQVFHVTQT